MSADLLKTIEGIYAEKARFAKPDQGQTSTVRL